MEYRFREIRENLDLKQKQISKKLGVTRSNYSMWESEYSNIPLRKFNDYCNTLDYSMDYVARLTNKKTNNTDKITVINKKIMAERLKTIEKEIGKKGYQIANELGISSSTYSEYKTIKKSNLMQTLMVKQIASKYHYSIDWIVGRSNIKTIDN